MSADALAYLGLGGKARRLIFEISARLGGRGHVAQTAQRVAPAAGYHERAFTALVALRLIFDDRPGPNAVGLDQVEADSVNHREEEAVLVADLDVRAAAKLVILRA